MGEHKKIWEGEYNIFSDYPTHRTTVQISRIFECGSKQGPEMGYFCGLTIYRIRYTLELAHEGTEKTWAKRKKAAERSRRENRSCGFMARSRRLLLRQVVGKRLGCYFACFKRGSNWACPKPSLCLTSAWVAEHCGFETRSITGESCTASTPTPCSFLRCTRR